MAAPRQVLIMEDEMDMRFYLMTLVKSLGHEPVLAHNGEQGLTRLKTTRPDLIILDVMMPEKGGCKVYRTLNTEPEFKDIPLIMFSAVNRDAFNHYIKMLNAKMGTRIPEPRYFIEKTADPEYLKQVIEDCISQ